MPASTAATELTERLDEDLTRRFPAAVVEAEIATAERELAGQVPAGAVAELLHRLVTCRLHQRVEGMP